jgi:hypothetical protein
MKITGESTVTAYEKGKRIVFESKGGGIHSRWEWTINAEASATEVSLALTYTMPCSFQGSCRRSIKVGPDITCELSKIGAIQQGATPFKLGLEGNFAPQGSSRSFNKVGSR